MAVVARLNPQGELNILGEVNQRLPSISNGLTHYFSMDGKGGTFDCIGGSQPIQHTLKGVNLIEAMILDWRDPNSWGMGSGSAPTWDEEKQAIKFTGAANYFLKTPILVDTNKHYLITASIYQETANDTNILYLGGYGVNAYGSSYTTNYDYDICTSYDVPLGQWIKVGTNRYGTTNNSDGWAGGHGGIVTGPLGWTGANGLCYRYYFGGLFNYACANTTDVIYIKDLSIEILDDDNSNCTYTDDGIVIEAATTNLIPNAIKNSYPTIGNGWGTYNTNTYSGGYNVSIGTITDVTNNIVTYTPDTSKITLKTFSVITPQTSGGGVTGGTRYFVKVISPTQFTLHAYNSSQDGSVPYPQTISSVLNDIRVPLTLSGLTNMWMGEAHLPNSGIIKEIIKDGFQLDGKIHDCIRLHNEYRNDGITDGMAYSVDTAITSGTIYTFSFYVRCALGLNKSADTTFRVNSYNTGNSQTEFNVYSILTSDWIRCTYTFTAKATGNLILYFWPPTSGLAIDISEIQIEQNPFASAHTLSTRPITTGIEIDKNLFPQSNGTIYLTASLSKGAPSTKLFDNADSSGGNSILLNPDNTILFNSGGATLSYTVADISKEHKYAYIINSNSTVDCYVDDVKVGSITTAIYANRGHFWLGRDTDGTKIGSVLIKEMGVYNRVLSDTEIKKMAGSNSNPLPISSTGDILAKNIIEKPNGIPVDAIYFPLSIDGKDQYKLISSSQESNIIYSSDGAWVGTAVTNAITDQSSMTASRLKSAAYNNYLNEWTCYVASGSAELYRGISYNKTNAVATPGSTWTFTFEVYSNQVLPINIDVNNSGVTTATGSNDNDTSRIYSVGNTIAGGWKRMYVQYSFSSGLTQNFYMQNQIFLDNSFTPSTDVMWKVRNIMLQPMPFISPYTPTSLGTSYLNFNLYKDLGLDWSKDWSIIYFKKPIGTYNNTLTGYNIESLGCNSNSVGGSYIWWGKDVTQNIIASSVCDLTATNAMDPNKYFGNWRMISLVKSGTTITIKEWSTLEGIYTRTLTGCVLNPNSFVTQYGYDFKLGGWDNGSPCNNYYRDLIIVKNRAITDIEQKDLYKASIRYKDDTLTIQHAINEKNL